MDSNTLEYRELNPHCAFCKHAYLKFMSMRCSIDDSKRDLCAKKCSNYTPTLEPIEKRSLS